MSREILWRQAKQQIIQDLDGGEWRVVENGTSDVQQGHFRRSRPLNIVYPESIKVTQDFSNWLLDDGDLELVIDN